MTIAEVREKCKSFRDAIIIGILLLASSLSFGLGYLAGLDAGRGRVSPETPPALSVATTSASGQVVASRNGTKYYLPQCAGAARITDANKVWFASVSAAEAAGYTLAANCTSR